ASSSWLPTGPSLENERHAGANHQFGPDARAPRAAQPARYAAGTGERAEMIRDNSRREVPRISSDLISRSSDTEGSPASILAMRDWLDWRRFARSACVRLRRRRRLRRPVASRALRSMYGVP